VVQPEWSSTLKLINKRTVKFDAAKAGKPSIFNFVVGGIFFVIFPGLFTAIAPVTWIQFVRDSDHVSATTKTCVFFVIPYSTKTIDPVVGVDDRFKKGEFIRERGRENRNKREEDQAFLKIHGEQDSVEISVSPVSVKSAKEKALKFLDETGDAKLRLFVVANWKFGVFAGGALSLLTILYVVGWTIWLILLPFRVVKVNDAPDEVFKV
jgi:hypothetical protein